MLRGQMRSRDGATAVWTGADGSVMFGKVSPSSSSTDSALEEAETVRSTKLIAANARRVMDVLDRRQELAEGREKAKTAGKKRRWWSWRRRRGLDAEERAKELAGEVGMSVDNRGCIVSELHVIFF